MWANFDIAGLVFFFFPRIRFEEELLRVWVWGRHFDYSFDREKRTKDYGR